MALATAVPAAASVNGNTISGNVFLDYNANGQRDNLEPGVAGVTVSAYGPNNALLASTTTDGAGDYTLVVGPNVTARIEVTGLPPELRPGPVGPPPFGSRTTVTFATSIASMVNVGLVSPADYCDAKPLLAVPCYTNGDPTMSCASGFAAASGPALVSFPYFGPTGTPAKVAAAGQIGATWGVAYQRSTGSLFTSAMMKRHVGFGPSGPGAIYKIANPASAAPTITTWTDFNSTPHPAGADPHTGLSGCATTQSADPASFDAVGKISFGGLDLSPDESTLWVVNLQDRTAYNLDANSGALLQGFPLVPAFTSLYATGAVLCVNGELRPWAVRVRNDGLIFFGAVCSGENEPNPAVSAHSADHLHAYVIALDPGSGSFRPIIDFPMDPAHYPKDTNNVCTTAGNRWWPWMSVFPPFNNNNVKCPGINRLSYPAPILSDIEFDTDGSLILGIMDRFGNQGGDFNLTPSGAIESFTGGGDTVRVCNVGGTFYLEGDASGNCPQNLRPGPGPNGGQFYYNKGLLNFHPDTTQGGLALLPGSGQVVTTAGDVQAFESGGAFWLNNTTGTPDLSYQVYSGSTSTNGLAGKATGLGDLALLCQPAPIEVGNRVWNDLDGNGVQDPGEPGIAGVVVKLTCGGNTAMTTTNSAGEYYFNSQTNASGVLLPGATCELTIDLTLHANANALNGLVPTLRDYGADLANTDLDDSDGDPTLVPGLDVIRFTAGPAGYSDHSFDFGFQPPPGCLKFTPAVQCATDGSGNVVLNFVFTDLFSGPVYNMFITNLPAGVTASPSYFHFSTPINPGGTAAIGPITLHGAAPGPLTFTITIHNQDLVLCCQQDVTIIVPACDCGEILASQPFCPFLGRQVVSYGFQFKYLGVGTPPAAHLLVIPESPATFTVSPNDLVLSPPLTYGQTSGPQLVSLGGTQPNQQVCLRISANDASFHQCCSLLQCFSAPDCLFQANPDSLGLQAGRFSAGVQWRDAQGGTGSGQAVSLTDDTGYFWFFSADSAELAVKVVDGRPLNGNWWLFYAGLSDVGYTLTLTDNATGLSRTYLNPLGTMASAADTAAFAEKPEANRLSGGSRAPAAAGRSHAADESAGAPGPAALIPRAGAATAPRDGGCTGGDTGLCLDQRFRVEISWEDFQGRKGVGHAVALSSDTGYLWFFDASSAEVMVKILDGRALNGHWWVFYGALSNVRYTITVTDTETGASRTYANPLGHFGSMADTGAF